MAFSRVDNICQFLKKPFILLDFISHIIGFGARRGTFHYTIRRRRYNLYSLCFILYALSRRLTGETNFILCALCFVLYIYTLYSIISTLHHYSCCTFSNILQSLYSSSIKIKTSSFAFMNHFSIALFFLRDKVIWASLW